MSNVWQTSKFTLYTCTHNLVQDKAKNTKRIPRGRNIKKTIIKLAVIIFLFLSSIFFYALDKFFITKIWTPKIHKKNIPNNKTHPNWFVYF